MNKIHYMKMTILFTLIIIPLAMLSIYYNSAPIASLAMAFATYFILIANIWENNKNLKKQNIENRKNILLSLKYQKMEDYLLYLKKYCSETIQIYHGLDMIYEPSIENGIDDRLIHKIDYIILKFDLLYKEKSESLYFPKKISDIINKYHEKITSSDIEKPSNYLLNQMEQVSKIISNDSKIDLKNQEFYWELYERWFDIYLKDVELFREMYKNDFILWGYASLRKNVYDDDYNLIECFEEISKTLNKKNIAKIIFDEIY